MSDRPNILFINTDQHSWNAISAHGNAWLRTPAIDRLHALGVSFDRSYCTDPACGPARTSWMTGLYSSESGMPFNGGHLHDDLPDLGALLNASGYNAYHCSKWSVGGRQPDPSFKRLWSVRRAQAGGAEFCDPAATHAAIDFLSSYKEPSPFYLQIGYVNPHDLCEIGHDFVDKDIPGPLEQGFLSRDELPPLPDNFDYDNDETVLQMVCRRGDAALIHGDILRVVRQWGELEWRFFLWKYYRLIEKVDREIGLVLAALENSRHRDNTLIIFSADHGEAAGSHQMFQKFTLYEESIHVPFIVASFGDRFGIDAGRCDRQHFVSGVDLLPTVCDYAQVEIPRGVSGSSIRPLIENRRAPGRDFAYVESNYWGRALVTQRFKYICEYRAKEEEDFQPPGPDTAVLGREQLFDLIDDPGETRNLARQTGYAAELLEQRTRLQRFERTLNRRAMHQDCRKRIVHWGDRLKQFREKNSPPPSA